MKIKVLLLKKIPNIGNMHDIVEVSNGYALNYLVPQGLGKIPTQQDVKRAEEMRKKQSQKSDEMKAHGDEMKRKIESISPLMLKVKSTDAKTLYGSIAEKDIAEELFKQHKIEVEAKQIRMTHIKSLGSHDVKVNLGLGIHASLAVNVKEA
ncbi:MAG: 50S ribosomal protein L9 [Candidatus Gracilibacteria bacterium]